MIKRNRLIVLALSGALAAIAISFYLDSGAAARAGARAGARAATQTIDASKDPAAAGQAISDFCQVIADCKFVRTAPITVDYDPYRILGDALYNCGQADAEDAVTVSDGRSESTSVDESLSTKVKLDFIGLAGASVTAEVNSEQLDEVSTDLKQTNGVSVAPGTIGFTESRVPTASLSGDTNITSGVNLIAVTNLELTYPGFGRGSINRVDWRSVHQDMTADDRKDHCDNLPALYPIAATSVSKPPREHRVTVCPSGHRRCTRLWLDTGTRLRIPKGTNLTLARGSVIYASGTVGKRRTVLRATRHVGPGRRYALVLSGPRQNTMLQIMVRRRLTRSPQRTHPSMQ